MLKSIWISCLGSYREYSIFIKEADAGRAKRLSWMIERLDKNLKPM